MTTQQGHSPSIVADLVLYAATFSVTNVVSYVYLIVIGRTLTAAEFGVFNALSGLIAIAGSFAASFQIAVTQAAAHSPVRPTLAALMRVTARRAVPALVLVTALALPFADTIGASPTQVAVCGIALIVLFLGGTAVGFLVGMGGIRAQGTITLAGALARLATGWLLVAMGLGVGGAVLGYFFNYLVVLALALRLAWRRADAGPAAARSDRPDVTLERASMITIVLALAPFSLDQAMVQVFAPQVGGDFAALATLAKLVFFASYPITAVAYPRLLRLPRGRGLARLAVVAAGGLALVVALLAATLAAFPLEAMRLFFGDRFAAAAPDAAMLAFGVAAYSLSLFCAHALIACGSRFGFVPSLMACIAGVLLFAVRHDSLATVAQNMLWIYGLQLALMASLLAVTVGRMLKREAPPAPADESRAA